MAKCSYCNKKLNFLTKYVCNECVKVLCGKCLTKVDYDSNADDLLHRVDSSYTSPKYSLWKEAHYLCKSCAKSYQQKMVNMIKAIENNEDVKIVSSNYQGNRFDHLTKIQHVETYAYREKSDAEDDLKAMAKYLGCTHVLNVEWERTEDEEKGPKGGTHFFSRWSACGDVSK